MNLCEILQALLGTTLVLALNGQTLGAQRINILTEVSNSEIALLIPCGFLHREQLIKSSPPRQAMKGGSFVNASLQPHYSSSS